MVDDNGRAVTGLTPADFVVKESGKEREIASVAPASEKMRLALMVAYPLLGQTYVRQGLATFINGVCPSAEIALFMITQRAEKLVDFTSNPNVLVDAIRNLPVNQSAASAVVPDAIVEVAKQFEKAKPARPVIVLATTEQGLAAEDPDFILSQIAKSKAQFWAVSVGAGGSVVPQHRGRAAAVRGAPRLDHDAGGLPDRPAAGGRRPVEPVSDHVHAAGRRQDRRIASASR